MNTKKVLEYVISISLIAKDYLNASKKILPENIAIFYTADTATRFFTV